MDVLAWALIPPKPLQRSVTQNEAERWEEERDTREARAAELRRAVVEQYKAKGLELPAALRD